MKKKTQQIPMFLLRVLNREIIPVYVISFNDKSVRIISPITGRSEARNLYSGRLKYFQYEEIAKQWLRDNKPPKKKLGNCGKKHKYYDTFCTVIEAIEIRKSKGKEAASPNVIRGRMRVDGMPLEIAVMKDPGKRESKVDPLYNPCFSTRTI